MEKYRLNKEDVCLLVIDVQEKLVPIMKHGKAIIKNTQILLQGAKEMGIPVIATEQYPKGLGSTVADLRAFFEDEDVFAKNSFTAYTEDVKNKIETLSIDLSGNNDSFGLMQMGEYYSRTFLVEQRDSKIDFTLFQHGEIQRTQFNSVDAMIIEDADDVDNLLVALSKLLWK